ncbi:hypothetical protein CR513_33915, partial [Mucuna pruriens]
MSFRNVISSFILHSYDSPYNASIVDEAKLGGPVYYRWMYPIERFLGKLKSYVHNKAHLEGTIVVG